MKIAVDAMGGDYAPAVVMEAIQSVLKEIPDVEILLVGHTLLLHGKNEPCPV